MSEAYLAEEWGGAIASMGRLVDVRNFPQVAADALMGRTPAYLGRGHHGPVKHLDPRVIGALVFWSKGPAELLVNHQGLREVLITYGQNKAIVGLELSVTGFGGTVLEPGIRSPSEVANGLRTVLETGLIDADAVLLRYDPVARVRLPDGRLLRNDTVEAFEAVVRLFAPLGVRTVECKPLLFSPDGQYRHVWRRMQALSLTPERITSDEFRETFALLGGVAHTYGMSLFTCCVSRSVPGWTHDSGCLSAERLTRVGQRLFGPDWNRLSAEKRPSRPKCQCSKYFDLSNIRGHRRCGSQDAACLYCTASAAVFGPRIQKTLHDELAAFLNGERDEAYRHLV